MAPQTKENYKEMTREELYEKAREKDIPDKSSMDKEELVNALENFDGKSKSGGRSEGHQNENRNDPSAPGHGGGQGDSPQPKGASPDEFKNIPGNQS